MEAPGVRTEVSDDVCLALYWDLLSNSVNMKLQRESYKVIVELYGVSERTARRIWDPRIQTETAEAVLEAGRTKTKGVSQISD